MKRTNLSGVYYLVNQGLKIIENAERLCETMGSSPKSSSTALELARARIHDRARYRRVTRENTKDSSSRNTDLKGRRKAGGEFLQNSDLCDGSSDDDLGTLDASRLFDLDGNDTLVQVSQSSRVFLLSSMFAENFLLASTEHASCSECTLISPSEATLRRLVHSWHSCTYLAMSCQHGMLQHCSLGYKGLREPALKSRFARHEESLFASTASMLLYSAQVGIYTPVPPPLASLLLELGQARASERILYEKVSQSISIRGNAVTSAETALQLESLYSREGLLRAGLDPLEHYHQRPPLYHSAEYDTLRKRCSYLRTYVQPGCDESVSGGVVQGADLQISLASVALFDHPLFGPEDRLYSQLRLLYGEYHRHLKVQASNYLKLRLQTLLDALAKRACTKEACLSNSEMADAFKLSTECFRTLELLASEEQTLSELAEALYTTWNQLKGLRQHQRFISTPAKLVAINVHHSNQSSSRRPRPCPIKKMLSDFEAMLPRLALLASAQKDSPAASGKLRRESLMVLFRRCRKSLVLTSDFVLKLYTTAELTSSDDRTLPVQEVMRRRRVHQYQIYAILKVNDRKVAAMSPRPIAWPAFMIQFDQKLKLRVARRPAKVEIHLWQRRLAIDLCFVRLLVPVPGMSPHHDTANNYSLAPLADWFQFTSPEVEWDVKFVVGEDVDVYVMEGATTKLLGCICKACSGGSWRHRAQGGTGTWTRGVIAAVRWRCYDIRLHHKLLHAIPASSIRRHGAVFEARQRQLAGAALISVHWTTNLQNWVDSPHTSAGRFAGICNIPPRPSEPSHQSTTSWLQSKRAGTSDPYFNSVTASDSNSNTKTINHPSKMIGYSDLFDPNDPRCASLVHRLTKQRTMSLGLSEVFRVDETRARIIFRAARGQVESECRAPLEGCGTHVSGSGSLGVTLESYNRIASPSRHRLLRLRMYQPTFFDQPLPATDAATSTNTYLRGLILQDDMWRKYIRKKPIDADEANGRHVHSCEDYNGALAFIRRVQECITERGRSLNDIRSPLSAIVSEGTPLPQLRARGLVDVALEFTARRRRALRPPRQRRTSAASPGNDCSILVQVVSAHHVLERPQVDIKSKTGTIDSMDTTSRDAKARLASETGFFVSATFQEHRRRTMLAMGYTPRWKETLDLPFLPTSGDFSPTNLMQVGDCLRLILFSETALSGLPGYDLRQSDNHQNESPVRRAFVGDVEIPFTTLYCNGGIEGFLEGTFELRTPVLHLSTRNRINAPRIVHDGPGVQDREFDMYIHLAIFLRPPLAAPVKLPTIVSSLEEESLIRYGTNWIQQLRIFLENINEIVKRPVDGRIPKRVVTVFGNNMKGDAVLICRYLLPQNPPPGIDSLLRAARFVSLIPFLDDWQTFGCANLDVWCTSQEFLDIGAGDWEEHGILLHNFIWWLQIHANVLGSTNENIYLVIGSGIPEGNTVYVMQQSNARSTRVADGVTLWNACTGETYSATDSLCPLVDIGCILNVRNVFANLQGVMHPHLLTYEFDDNNCWRPFFSDPSRRTVDCCAGWVCVCNPGPTQISRPKTLTSVQEISLQYDGPDVIHAEKIQTELGDEIKASTYHIDQRACKTYSLRL